MNIYKTMYHPHKAAGIDDRRANIVGGGIAGLATAAFLIDDAKMPGDNITIYEKKPVMGGSMDGTKGNEGYLCRAERELEPYMECLWYLCSKIPSLENECRTVLDDVVDFNRDDPIHSEARVIVNQGEIDGQYHNYKLPQKYVTAMAKIVASSEEELANKRIDEFFDEGFFKTNFWVCFHSQLAFKHYHSAIECRRYWQRFTFINRHEYLEGFIHTKYNEYDAIILPIERWLIEHGVHFVNNFTVYDLTLDQKNDTVQAILAHQDDKDVTIPVSNKDLVFVTSGSISENSTFGDNDTVAVTNTDTEHMGTFTIWKNLAKKDAKFGHPEKFLGQIDKTKWISFFPTVKGYPEFFKRIEELSGSKAGTGGLMTFRDSNWDMSFEIHHKPFFPYQASDEEVGWGYGLYGENVGNYVKKRMWDCTGDEIMTELLYHLGMLDIKDEVLKHTYMSTAMMPYVTSQFMPRQLGDRPKVVPDGCTNLAFLGQFVEIDDDVVFTVETSVRTGLESVYELLNIDKDVIEVNPSRYDIRYLLERVKRFNGIKGKIKASDLPAITPEALPAIQKMLLDYVNNVPPYYQMYLGRDKTIPLKESVLHPKAPHSK
ncbi:oleate hydratase [Companilactobacillus nantensis]|uniref:Myosin-cross-reactive antigen n=1 Tax=Companilactobacillus nantensis DSM 16982 TaxID=1423774 RepID=A0A0R1WS67_9LACO|nr:oleate hydratase [Companilactobacillus nantensis]KRM17971.1 myosin-cross-reactive antigen [Companilactobacillus nantensis DSM 16982]GEO63634.1 oleate hydratase [Companilactobacillus nantensis]